jgi:hypothetical protein
MTPRRLCLVACLGAMATASCSRPAPNATPEGAVREFIERMRMVDGDPADAKAAFELLSSRAKANLAERAQRYSAATGKAIAPEAMIAPSRFLLRFEPQRYTAQVAGPHARVEVLGLLLQDRAQVQCVYEEVGWRVDLGVPPLPPVQQAPAAPSDGRRPK